MSELGDFVLAYYAAHGALIEPPQYGVYEVVLPDALAAQLSAPAFQRIAFGAPEVAGDDTLHLAVGHPLVERMVERTRQAPAPTQVYINAVRLDKHGLLDLARQALAFPNARLVAAPRQTEARALCHYVRFTFKLTLTTDEKHEHLVSVVMDAQAGWPVNFQPIEAQVALDEQPGFANLSPARPRWIKADHPLAPAALAGLLERAQQAVVEQAAGPLESARRRAARYLELDRARLEQYYDDIAGDLERRIQRADLDRRPALQDKLAAVQAERQLKLADAEARYRLRVDLELITAQVIVQPKVMLVVQIENRTAAVQRLVVWDPLLHSIEPLMCDVCGKPGLSLHLCTGAHLAHTGCLLEHQCVDCKRVYCRLCQRHVEACVVCERAVCVHSLNKCGECGRGTCREHVGMCHAADGEPVKLAQLAAPERAGEALPEPAVEASPEPAAAQPRPEKRSPQKLSGPRMSTALRRSRERAASSPSVAVAARLVVQIEPREPVVTAFAVTSGGRDLAVRTWELTPRGISVECACEKSPFCPADMGLIRPESAQAIEAQLEAEIAKLRQEYQVPARRVEYLLMSRGEPTQAPRLVLHGLWKDAGALAQALAGWEAEFARRRPPLPPLRKRRPD